jgi:hypothetical protein
MKLIIIQIFRICSYKELFPIQLNHVINVFRIIKVLFASVSLSQPVVSAVELKGGTSRLNVLISASAVFFFTTNSFALDRKVIRTDTCIYTIVSDNAPDENSVESFDRQFSSQSEEIYTKMGVKCPEQFRITLCIGAWIFKKETGLDEHTAGLYYPSRKTFVFQNPKALDKRGMLLKTIRHELCHGAIDEWRQHGGIEYNPGKNWLEESLCTALYPADDYSMSEGERMFASMNNSDKKVSVYLNQKLKAADYEERRKAYSLAHAYGRYLLSKKRLEKIITELK